MEQVEGASSSGGQAGNDSITNQMAGMSKHQLYEIVAQMKDLINQNKQQAREILIANPQLTKALFQAQVMLGMVRPPQVMPNILVQQASTQNSGAQDLSQEQLTQAPQLQTSLPPKPSQQVTTVQGGSSIQQSQPQTLSPQIPPQTQGSQRAQNQSQTQQTQHPSQPQSLQYPSSGHHHLQQPHSQTSPGQSHLQAVGQPPTHAMPAMQQQALPGQHPSLQNSGLLSQQLQPPLPQQPRPPAPNQLQPQPQPQPPLSMGMGFQPHAPSQQLPNSQPSFQQPVGLVQTSVASQYQHSAQTPLPNQIPQQSQHSFQFSRPVAELNTGPNISQGGFPSSSTISGGPQFGRAQNVSNLQMPWNQLPLSGASVTHSGTPSGHMVHSHSNAPSSSGVISMQQDGKAYSSANVSASSSGLGLSLEGVVASQGYNYGVPVPAQPYQQLPQSQMLELEQQNALLQQVINLTPEQINMLPPEQRQQVIQLQQAFRN